MTIRTLNPAVNARCQSAADCALKLDKRMNNRRRILLSVVIPVCSMILFLIGIGFTGNIRYWPDRHADEKKRGRWTEHAERIDLFATNNWELDELDLRSLPHGTINLPAFTEALAGSKYRRIFGIHEGRGFVVVATMRDEQKERMILGYTGDFYFPTKDRRGYFVLPPDQRQKALYDEVARIIDESFAGTPYEPSRVQPGDAENTE